MVTDIYGRQSPLAEIVVVQGAVCLAGEIASTMQDIDEGRYVDVDSQLAHLSFRVEMQLQAARFCHTPVTVALANATEKMHEDLLRKIPPRQK